MPELNVETPHLKMLNAYVIGHKEVRLEINRKFLLHWLAFVVPEGTEHFVGEE